MPPVKFWYTKSVLMDLPIEMKQPKSPHLEICLALLKYVILWRPRIKGILDT